MKKKIKVLHVSVRLDTGGGPKHICQLVKNYPSFIESYTAGPRDKPHWEELESFLGQENMFALPHRSLSLKAIWGLVCFIKENEIDVIHSDSKGGGLYGRISGIITGVPVVHTFNGIHIGEYNPVFRFLYLKLEWLLTQFSRKIIAVSESERKDMLRLGIASLSQVTQIGNCIELPDIRIDPSLVMSRMPHQIAYIGYYSGAKNPAGLVEIALEMKKRGILDRFNFLFIGDGGPLKQAVMARIRRNDLMNSFTFINYTDNVFSYLSESFAYISTSRWEGMPLAVIEAMSVGLPVIATDVTGNRDLVRNQVNGFLYDYGDACCAVDAICKIADDPDLYNRLSTASVEIARNAYSVERMVNSTVRLYNSVLAPEK